MLRVVLYARISTTEERQSLDNQMGPLHAMCEREGLEIVGEFTDTAKAKDVSHRREWERLMTLTRAKRGRPDVVVATRLDRCFRSIQHMRSVIDEWTELGVQFWTPQHKFETQTALGRLFLNIMGMLAEFEVDLLNERVREGIANARVNGTRSGKPIGRPRAVLTVRNVLDALARCDGHVRQAARLLSDETGATVSPGLVAARMKEAKEAE